MADIFLSYAREDPDTAKLLAEALRMNGWSVWWDRTIPVGKTFDEVIERELSAAHGVVVLWSSASVQSKWVRNEALEADARGILIPVVIEAGIKIPLAFRGLQAAELVGGMGRRRTHGSATW